MRIQREQMLQPQDAVGEEAAHQAEQQHGEGVLLPILLSLGLNAHQPIGQPLKRLEDRVEPGSAIGIEHLHQVKAHRFSDRASAATKNPSCNQSIERIGFP